MFLLLYCFYRNTKEQFWLMIVDGYESAQLNIHQKKLWTDELFSVLPDKLWLNYLAWSGQLRITKQTSIPKGWSETHGPKLENNLTSMKKAYWGNVIYDSCSTAKQFITMKLNMWWRSWYTTPPLGISYILHTTSYILHTTYYILHPTYYILHPTSYILHTTSYILHTTYYILHTTYYILHTTYYILHTKSVTKTHPR